jgi:hypothetical protein
MKALNKVIIKIGDPFLKEVEYKSLKLKIDPEFDPTKYVKTVGKIVACSDKHKGIKEGDVVAIHYGGLDINPCDKKVQKGQYLIDYKDILCKIENNTLISVGNWVVAAPIMVPVNPGYHVEKEDGKTMLVSDKTGLVVANDFKEETENSFKVVSDSLNPEINGKTILTQKDCDFDNYGRKIFGKKFYYIERDLILTYY